MGGLRGKAEEVCQGIKKDDPSMPADKRARIANAVASKIKKTAGYPEAEAAEGGKKSGNIYPELLTELAAKVARKHLDSGTPLNEILAEEANELTPEQLQTVCQLANRAVHGALRKDSQFVKFPVADTSGVKNILIAQNARGKAKKLLDSLPDDVPGPSVPKEASYSTRGSYSVEKVASALPPAPTSPARLESMAEDLCFALDGLSRAVDSFLKEASGPEDYTELFGAATFVDYGHAAPFCTAHLLSTVRGVPDLRDLEKVASTPPNPYVPIVQSLRKVADLGDAYLSSVSPSLRDALIQGLSGEVSKVAFLTPLFLGWHLWDKGKESLKESKVGKQETLASTLRPLPKLQTPTTMPGR